MLHKETLLALQRKGKKGPEGGKARREPKDMGLKGRPVGARERKAHVPKPRIRQAKGKGSIDQPGHGKGE